MIMIIIIIIIAKLYFNPNNAKNNLCSPVQAIIYVNDNKKNKNCWIN